ncbi:MAG: type 4a pilus biogenesis protein PilO [Desulfobacteraceae bacterium]|nr:type 4a pilus biogenesis protein PilO [Desulfobacteraceae bacterium]
MKNKSYKKPATAQIFESLEKLTKPQRIGIWVGAMVLIIGLSGWFQTKPQYEQVEKLRIQLQKLKDDLEVAKRNAKELNDWRNKMKTKEAKYKTVMRALPEKEEIPSLLAGISQAGKDAGLEFLLFQPKPETAKGFYAEIPVDINVTGSYHEVAVFFDKVSNLHRIVNIRNIKMTPESKKKDSFGGDLKTACQAVTYKFIEQSEKASSAKNKRRTRRR